MSSHNKMQWIKFITYHAWTLHLLSGLGYRLEKQEAPGVAVDLDSPLSTLDTLEFCLVRENSKINQSVNISVYLSFFVCIIASAH